MSQESCQPFGQHRLNYTDRMKSCNPFMILSHAKKNTLRIVDRFSVVVVVEASGKSRFPRVYESRHLHVFIKEFLIRNFSSKPSGLVVFKN